MVGLEGFAVSRDLHRECFPRGTKAARDNTYLSGCGLVPVKLCLQETRSANSYSGSFLKL